MEVLGSCSHCISIPSSSHKPEYSSSSSAAAALPCSLITKRRSIIFTAVVSYLQLTPKSPILSAIAQEELLLDETQQEEDRVVRLFEVFHSLLIHSFVYLLFTSFQLIC